MHNDFQKNNDFQITFCETNLRWLAGEPPSDERDRKMQVMVLEIERLKKLRGSADEHKS